MVLAVLPGYPRSRMIISPMNTAEITTPVGTVHNTIRQKVEGAVLSLRYQNRFVRLQHRLNNENRNCLSKTTIEQSSTLTPVLKKMEYC